MSNLKGGSSGGLPGAAIGKAALAELRRTPLLALIVFVPVVIFLEQTAPQAHTWLFFLSVAAIIPLAALLSRATEAVAAKNRRYGGRPA
ncbi:Ca2+/H+ antiporter [Sinorhizobium terangae]|nr:Ca2+/H+ antiporter [Sinorhizobium terangae]